MASTGRFEHSELNGGVMAENIAHGQPSAQAVTDGWLASKGHRANMLNCDYTHTGLGWTDGYWVQQFGKGAVAPAPAPATSVAQQAVDIARSKIGSPYIWGAKGPSAFDCSGLMQYVYSQLGITIGTSTHSQRYNGWNVGDIQPGDLVFISNSSEGAYGHVAIMSGWDANGAVLVIEAQQPGIGVVETPLSWYDGRVTEVRRIV